MLLGHGPWRYAAAILAGLLLALLGLAFGARTAQAATSSDDLVIVSNAPSPTHAVVGGAVTFTITAKNNGTVAEQPAIVDRGISALNVVSESCPGGTSGGNAAGELVCSYPPLAPGATVTATLTAQIVGTPDPTASNIMCVAPADQVSSTFDYPPGGCQTATVTIDPNLSGVGYISADLEVDAITPSVTHAKPGDVVTYTIVATNHGRDAGWMFVITAAVTEGLATSSWPSPLPIALCGAFNGPAPTPTAGQGVTPDGDACEYGLVPPGDTVIDTFTTQVQGPGYATDTACAEAVAQGDAQQFSPTYPCKTAVVAVDADATTTPGPTPPPSPPARTLGPVTAPAATPPPTGMSDSSAPGPKAASCAAYTARRWRYTILTHHNATCSQSRALIHRADHALRRTGVNVKVSAWSCRREPLLAHGVMWLDSCRKPRGALVIWTERRAG